MSTKRIKWIDEVRGLAIILVIIGHVVGGVDERLGGGEENVLRVIIYSFHMPLMFMVSGLVSSENKSDRVKQFIGNLYYLFVALYIPYLLWGYCFWATKYFIYAGNESVSLKQGLELWWNNSAWIPGWYLLTLLFIKVLDIVVNSLIHNSKVKMAIWFVLFMIGGCFGDIYLISNVLKYGIYFQIGKLIKNMGFQENNIINCKNCFILLCVASIFRFANDFNYIMDFAIAFSLSFIIIFLCAHTKYHSSAVETMGKASMVPYVLHAYMTIPIRIILQKYNMQDFAVYVIAETGFAILFSLIVIKFMDNSKWIKSLFYPMNVLAKRDS